MKALLKNKIELVIKFIVVVIVIVCAYFIGKYIRRNTPAFEIKSIYITSSAFAKENEDKDSFTWNLDVSQNNNIYINLGVTENQKLVSGKNGKLKEAWIKNVRVTKKSIAGNVIKNYKITNSDFNQLNYIEENEIKDIIKYEVVAQNADVLHSQINEDYGQMIIASVNNTVLLQLYENEVIFDGRLLKDSQVTNKELEYVLSFDIVLVTQENRKCIANVDIKLPLDGFIDNGFAIKVLSNTAKFIYVKEEEI